MTGWSISLPRAARRLIRAPGFTVPALLILALGIGATTSIFTVVRDVVLEPLPFPGADRLVQVCERHPEALAWCGAASAATVDDFRAQSTAYEDLGVIRSRNLAIRDEVGITAVDGGLVTPGLLDLFRTPPALGRLFAPDEAGPAGDEVVILSHGLWTQRYGGDPDVLGRTLDVEGDVSTIVGVMPEGFEVPGLEWARLWKPIPWDLSDPEIRGWRGMRAFGRLKPGVSYADGRADLERVYRALGEVHEAITPEWRVDVRPALDLVVGRSTRVALYVFLGAVGLLLLIGCINVANLLLARGTRRQRDFAVRHALGAGRSSLIGEVLAESVLLSGAAAVAGLPVAWAGLRAFLALAPPYFPRLDEVGLDGTVLLFVLVLTGLTALLFGLVPALRTSEASPAVALRGVRGAGPTTGEGLRRTLVVTELALSMVLLASAGLLARSFMGFLEWDPGYDTEGLVFLQAFAPMDRYPDDQSAVALWREVESRVEALPGIEATASASGVPLRSSFEGARYRVSGQEGVPEPEVPTAAFFDVGPGYFETMGISVVRGREFTESDDLGSTPVAMVNETFARRTWPDRDPVGRSVWADFVDQSMEVVGVVADLDPLNPGEAPGPEIYWPNRQGGVRWATMIAARTRGDPALQTDRIREEILALDPGLAVSPRGTVESLLEGRLVRPRFNMLLIGAFAVAAVLLAALGTYGVLAYLVVERNREFGIRIALGARRRRILRGVLEEGAILAVVGSALGILGALAASELIRGVIYGVEPSDPPTLAAASALLILLSLLACAVPAFRASRADPVALLKEE